MVCPRSSQKLSSIRKLANHGISSVFTKEGVDFYKGFIKSNGNLLGNVVGEDRIHPVFVGSIPALSVILRLINME